MPEAQDMLTPNRLTTREITECSWKLTQGYGQLLGIQGSPLENPEHWDSVVRSMLLESHNPNGIMLVAKNHDEAVAQKLKAGWRYGPILDIADRTHPDLLPFLQLPPETRAKALFFRQTVVSLQPFWSQH